MTSEDGGEFDVKQSRLDDPSGWMKLTRYETVRLLIDALLEAPPEYKFNKSELARRTGLSKESVRQHLPLLVEMGIVEEIEGSEWAEYQLNDDGKVTKELFQLNSAANSVLSGEPKNVANKTAPAVSFKDPNEDNDEFDKKELVADIDGVDNYRRDDSGDTLIDSPPTKVLANAD